MSTSIIMRTANFFTGRTQRIFLWNVFISVRRSWCYSSWWSKLSRSLCLNSYFISNSNIFLQKRHNKFTLTSIDSQVYYWRADRRHQRHVSGLRHTFQSPYYLSARFARRFFFFFPQYGTWSQATILSPRSNGAKISNYKPKGEQKIIFLLSSDKLNN